MYYGLSRAVTANAAGRTRLSGSNSAVECQLPKLDVAGSIPVSRSMKSTLWLYATYGGGLYATYGGTRR